MARRFLLPANIRWAVVVLFGVTAAAGARGDAPGVAAGGAPYEVLASGFEDPSGLAVERDGAVLVTDRRAGTLTRISAVGARQIVLRDLHEPRGVAAGADGVYLLEGSTHVLRVDPNGMVSLVSASLKQARAIAAEPDGRIWIAARREHGPDDEIVRLEASGTLIRIASGLIGVHALAVDQAAIYVALEALVGEGRQRTTLARLPRRPDGTTGPAESLLRYTHREPDGLAIDAAGDLFITGSLLEHWHPRSGVVLKRRAGGRVSLVAFGLSRPSAAAFGPGRELFIVEATRPGRVVRFHPPERPVMNVPPFTNETPVRITGRAQPGSLVQLFGTTNSRGPAAAVMADPRTGDFAVSAALVQNGETPLSVVATAGRGSGLVSLPALASIVHDDHLPVVDLLEPPAAAFVNSTFVVRARALDAGSGVAELRVMLDDVTQASFPASPPHEPVTATAVLSTTALREGPHTLTVGATDRAGNWAGAAQLIVVDRTPPDTSIRTGPPADTADRHATFTLGGFDAQSVDLEFAWRLDGGPWSPFSAAAEVQLNDLAAGLHRFEAAARDRAGNVDATPAVQAFTVIALRVRIAEPIAGSVISTQTVWVRGTIESPQDVAVSLPLPEAYQKALALEALAAPHEAGTFAAEVPVLPGMTSVAVVVRDGAGGVATDTAAINVQAPLSPALRLQAFPPAGLAPHTVRFPVNVFPAGSAYSLDLESDGITDYAGNALPDQEFVYARPGIHLATLRIVTPDGRMLVARAAIEVYDRARLEARLQAMWAGFKGALRGGNAAAAAAFLHSDRRAAWTEYFGRLTPAQFAATDTTFTDIVLLEVAPGRAECEMMRDVGGLLYSFPVSFEIDLDGGWKLWQF